MTQASGQLVDITSQSADVLERNRTSVTPADQACSGLSSNVQALQNLVDLADNRVTLANGRARASRAQIDEITADLMNVRQLDSVRIEELRQQVRSVQTEFNQRQLGLIAQELVTFTEEQRTWLAQMQEQKVIMQAKVQQLRSIQSQLRRTFP